MFLLLLLACSDAGANDETTASAVMEAGGACPGGEVDVGESSVYIAEECGAEQCDPLDGDGLSRIGPTLLVSCTNSGASTWTVRWVE